MSAPTNILQSILSDYRAAGALEAEALECLRELCASGDAWSRDAPLHVTGSAIVIDRAGRRVLLRWHDRLERWLHVGGHGDAGENDPAAVAIREAHEETGLADLEFFDRAEPPTPVHVAVVSVPARAEEVAHEHGDIRYVLVTDQPDQAIPESATTPLRWLELDEARAELGEDSLGTCLQRVQHLVAQRRVDESGL